MFKDSASEFLQVFLLLSLPRNIDNLLSGSSESEMKLTPSSKVAGLPVECGLYLKNYGSFRAIDSAHPAHPELVSSSGSAPGASLSIFDSG